MVYLRIGITGAIHPPISITKKYCYTLSPPPPKSEYYISSLLFSIIVTCHVCPTCVPVQNHIYIYICFMLLNVLVMALLHAELIFSLMMIIICFYTRWPESCFVYQQSIKCSTEVVHVFFFLSLSFFEHAFRVYKEEMGDGTSYRINEQISIKLFQAQSWALYTPNP